MPGRIKLRKVVAPPAFSGYRPYGASGRATEQVELLYEEYEALKLADYDQLDHVDAALLMGVSRPTFARIYESARRKIAAAFVEVKSIKTVYGNAWMEKDWFVCEACHSRFTIPEHSGNVCPLCSSVGISPLNGSNKTPKSDEPGPRKGIIAITSTYNRLAAPFDQRFGRSAWFCILNEITGEITFVENKFSDEEYEAGVNSAEEMIRLKVNKVFSGDFGSKALEKLSNAGIQLTVLRNYTTPVGQLIRKIKGKWIEK